MKRPYISISGTLDELILMEAILAHYYTVTEEDWNNTVLTDDNVIITHLICNPADGCCGYYNHKGFSSNKENSFKASQLEEILTYIEEYERS